MEKEEFIYDSTKNKKYYKGYLSQDNKKVLLVVFSAVFGMGVSIYAYIDSPSLNTIEYIFPFFIGCFFVAVFFPLSYRQDKILLEKGLFGLQINEESLRFFGRMKFFRQKKKYWSLEDIDFVFIDENIGFTVIKTVSTPQINIDSSLLQKPKKFWLKIHWKDRYNNFNTKMISDLEVFINALRYYGVKVYYRRKGSNVIEVAN